MDLQSAQLRFNPPPGDPDLGDFKIKSRDAFSVLSTGVTGVATWIIVSILAFILIVITTKGWNGLSWTFLTTVENSANPKEAGVLGMVVGTTMRVFLMTLFVIPVGVVTAVYLSEYSRQRSLATRIIRNAVNNLAGVPSIVFGLFGLGFFIGYLGSGIDSVLLGEGQRPVWGRPALIWASLTMAVMTLPVVIVATEESLNAIPQELREASLALGASRIQTISRILLPQALPGILTGAILAVSRAAGEVAPLLFTGAAYYMAGFPQSLTDQFMDLGYQVYILSTQSPNIEETEPLLYATAIVLLFLTFALNITAIFVRLRMRRQIRALNQ